MRILIAEDDGGPMALQKILSGLGCDGATGAELIRVAGGRVLSQDPRSAEVASMPQPALDHGRPEAVLPIAVVEGTLDAWIGASCASGGEVRP